jgi:hypothetical protein
MALGGGRTTPKDRPWESFGHPQGQKKKKKLKILGFGSWGWFSHPLAKPSWLATSYGHPAFILFDFNILLF